MNHSKRILVIDDEERNRSVLEAMLRSLGYEAEFACNGAEGLEKLNSSFDLVLLDILMPGMDGHEVARRIRNRSDCGDIPIVMVTALTGKEDRLKAVTSGANDFIPKPVDRVELKVRVASLLKMKEATDALRRSEEKYRALVETVRDTIWSVDLDLRYTYVSPAVTQVLGFTVEEMMAKHPLDGLTPESRETVIKAFQEEMALEAAGPRQRHDSRTEEIARYHKDGSILWAEIRTTFLRDSEGKPVGILGISHDITERKRMEEALREAQEELEKRVKDRTAALVKANAKLRKEIRERERAEKALRESEQRLELALKGADLGLWDLDVQSGNVVVNRRLTEMIGYEPDEIETTLDSWENLLHPEDRMRAVAVLQAHLEGRVDEYEDEYRLKAKSGEWKWILSRGKVVERDTEGKPLRMAGTFLDITARKQSEESLRQSEERYRTVADFTYDWEYWADPSGKFVYVSPSCQRITGYSVQEFLDDPSIMEKIVHPDDRAQVKTHVQEVMQNDGETAHSLDFRILRRDGKIIWVNHACQAVRGNDGRPLGRRACNRDVTQRKRTEKALEENEARYRTLFENISNGVAIYEAIDGGDDFNIVDFNSAAEVITGVRRDRVLGKKVTEAFPGVKRFGLLDVLKTTWQTGQPAHHPITKYRDKHIEIWTENFVCKLPSGEVVAVFSDDTERKRAELALRESEEKYRLLVDKAPVGVLSVDRKGRILEVNRKLLEILGSPSAEATKSLNMLSFPPLVDAGISDVFSRCMESGALLEAQMPYTSKWGKTLYLRVLLTPLFHGEGCVKGCQAVMEDITHRKEAEDALRESQQMLESILAAVPHGIGLHRDRKIQWVNEAWQRMFGFTHSNQYVGQNTGILYPSQEAYEASREAVYEGLETSAVSAVEARLQRHDGTVFDAVARVTALDPSDVGKGVIAAITDVSERKRAEEALRQSEEKYRAMFNNAAVGIDLVDQDGRFIEANDTLARFLGYTQDELRHLTILDVTHPEDLTRSETEFHSLARGEIDHYRMEKRYVRKDGKVVWGDISVSALRDRNEQYLATVGVIADITQRKKSDEARLRLATAVEQAAETIAITDDKGTLLYVNPAFEQTTGYSREEAVGSNPRILKSGTQDDAFYKRMWETITRGNVWKGHMVNRKKDGTLFEEEATISPIKDHAGKIVSFVAVKRDVTKEVSLQKQLLQAQKMEAVGTLAGGIAHDFNNLLQVTLGYSELLLQEKEEQDPDFADLSKIFQAARNGAELVQRLLTFSRKVEPKPVPLDLNQQMLQVEGLLRRIIPKMIEIRLDLSGDLARVHADPTQMEQVLMNLAVNARDAMPDGGTLTIETRNVDFDAECCAITGGSMLTECVLVAVSDTGHGMTKETIEHIFEPFYTTKELGRGTGLGLAMVYGIIQQHHGYVRCDSEIGTGTTFKVWLPAMPRQEEIITEKIEIIPTSGTETILVVDDEAFVRELASRILTKAGYTVLEAGNGKEAREICDKDGERISLVILDLIMPEMGGAECLRELLEINPQTKVLIASGFSGDASVNYCLANGAKGFVRKPFRLQELLQQIRHVLDED